MPETTPSATPVRKRRFGGPWSIIKWTLFGLVLLAVGHRVYELSNREELAEVQFHVGWLLLAGVAYLASWIPSIWLWQRLMQSMGATPVISDTIAAYYCGHLGKYIPGKATVLIVRASMLKNHGVRPTTAALTATYETLALIGVGAALGIALAPSVLLETHWNALPEWLRPLRDYPLLAPLLIGIAGFSSLPFLSKIFTHIAVRMTPRELENERSGGPVVIQARLLILGSAAYLLSWTCQGISLGCTLRALSDQPLQWQDLPMWTAGVAFSTAIGFLAVFAPGGLGVREGLLIELLRIQPNIGEQRAVIAAILLRGTWLAAEVLAALAFYWLYHRRKVLHNSQK